MSVFSSFCANSSVSLRLGSRDGPILKGSGSRPQIDFLATSKEDFYAVSPSSVLAWLFHEKHDAFQIARWLVNIDFKGVFYGVCQPLPRKQVVIRDMQRAFPQLRFDLMVLSDHEINHNPYEATLRFHNKPPKKARETKSGPLQTA